MQASKNASRRLYVPQHSPGLRMPAVHIVHAVPLLDLAHHLPKPAALGLQWCAKAGGQADSGEVGGGPHSGGSAAALKGAMTAQFLAVD